MHHRHCNRFQWVVVLSGVLIQINRKGGENMAQDWSRMDGLSERNPVRIKTRIIQGHNQDSCKSWFRTEYNNPLLRHTEIVYCEKIAPNEYEEMVQWYSPDGWQTVEWIGKGCCEYSAKAKALSDFKDNLRTSVFKSI